MAISLGEQANGASASDLHSVGFVRLLDA